MDPTPVSTNRRERAAERLAERRRHVRRIRVRVAGLSLATFLAASGAVLVQLVTGHDPALTRDATAHTASSTHAASTGHTASVTAAVRPSAVTTSAS